MRKTLLHYSFLLFLFIQCSPAKEKVDIIKEDNPSLFRIIAYYAGPPDVIDSFDYQNITHLIFSFGHLK